MNNNINENPDKISEIESGGVELASLVWTYFSKDNFKEILKEDFKLIKRLKRWLEWLKNWSKNKVKDIIDWEEVEYKKEETSKLEKIIKEKEKKYNEKKDELKKWIDLYIRWKLWEDFENNGIEEDDDSLDYILSEWLEVNDLERIRELYSNEDVRSLYLDELNKRKDKFEIINNWKKGVFEILKIESTIKKAEKIILSLRIKSFISGKSLNPAEVSKIKQIQKKIKQEERKINQLLNSRENATVYRLNKLKSWKKELEDSGFVTFESRKKIIDCVTEKLLMGENILLAWPTWTGKTVLAVKAVESLNRSYSDISWKSLINDIRSASPKKNSWIVDDFAMVLSGHSWITASDFIAKPALKWEIETTTELWKLLKAFVEWKVPIIDEIDLIPNDVIMRVKHLFTLKSWSQYAPQEDSNSRITLHSTWIIATANIKSEKHPDREEIDPAILRLFSWIQVSYLNNNEAYDLALIHMMESQGYIYWLSKEELWKDWILYNLVKALKEIEDSYLWKWSELKISLGLSDKSWVHLQKAILEIWKFVSLFNGFRGSQFDFKKFIKIKIADFLSNPAYPTIDRLLLIKIFSQNWLIIKSDIWLLEDRMIDVDRTDLDRNIMSDNDIFKDSGTKFIDPYDLANLDPYEIRKLDEIDFSDNTKKQEEFLQYLAKSSVKNDWNENRYEIGVIANRLLEDMEWKKDFEIPKEDIDSLAKLGWASGFEEPFIDFVNDLWWYFLEKFEAVGMEIEADLKKLGNDKDIRNMFGDEVLKKFKEGEKFVCIERDWGYWFVDRDWDWIESEYFWDRTWQYKDGVAIGKKDDIYWIINKEWKLISNFYDYIDDFKEGFARVKKDEKRWFIDIDWNKIWELVYDYVWDFNEGFAQVKKDEKRWFIDTDWKEFPNFYDYVYEFREGFAQVKKGKKWWFIDTNWKEFPNFYDYVYEFNGGFAPVKKGKKQWFIDTDWNEIWELVYDDVWHFNEGFAQVEKGDKRWFIDTNWKEIWELVYDDVWDFNEGFARVEKAEKRWFIDTDWNEIWELVYDYVWDFNEGFAIVKKGKEWWFIDTNWKFCKKIPKK